MHAEARWCGFTTNGQSTDGPRWCGVVRRESTAGTRGRLRIRTGGDSTFPPQNGGLHVAGSLRYRSDLVLDVGAPTNLLTVETSVCIKCGVHAATGNGFSERPRRTMKPKADSDEFPAKGRFVLGHERQPRKRMTTDHPCRHFDGTHSCVNIAPSKAWERGMRCNLQL